MRSGDAMCDLPHTYEKDMKRESPSLGLKTGGYSLLVCASKSRGGGLSVYTSKSMSR
jgi:hypothetical protein